MHATKMDHSFLPYHATGANIELESSFPIIKLVLCTNFATSIELEVPRFLKSVPIPDNG